MATLVNGNRGGKILQYLGFRYQKNRIRNDKIYWRCWRDGCRAPLQSNYFDLNTDRPEIRVLNVGEHIDHDQDTGLIDASRLAQIMIQNIERDPSRPVKRTYDGALLADHNVDDDEIPTFNSLRSKLSRKRLSLMPPIPNNVEDVRIEDEYVNTWRHDRFLSHQDNDWGFVVFATEANLIKLQRCNNIYVDGTFKTCPPLYVQFVTVHGMYHGRVLPFAMSLLTGKTVGHYRQLLQHIKMRARQLTGHNFRPRLVISDFEISLLLAVETELPRSRRAGCYFHLCQSLWRKIQEIGLARPYARRRRLRKCLQKFMAIGYLPLALVRQNFQLLATANSTGRLIRRYPDLQAFIMYMQRNYFDGEFPPEMWNVFNRDSDTRTNNFVEGFHSRWNQTVGRKHPSLWIFIRKLKDEQRLLEISAAAARRGDAPQARKRKWRELDERVRRLKRDYNEGRRTLREYWNAMVYAIKTYV